jgi:hypothetical protein
LAATSVASSAAGLAAALAFLGLAAFLALTLGISEMSLNQIPDQLAGNYPPGADTRFV